mmetsp:Transcript_4948/g.9565  ORF Transcript_4948/g.9565 Transcript_4948/m.9565 type:complete len:375 (-) Transcript_4948:36-1160(-)
MMVNYEPSQYTPPACGVTGKVATQQKISCSAWIPAKDMSESMLVTGAWGDQSNELSIRKVVKETSYPSDEEGMAKTTSHTTALRLGGIVCKGDVVEVDAQHSSIAVSAWSTGHMRVHQLEEHADGKDPSIDLKEVACRKDHTTAASSVHVQKDSGLIATTGEDGRIVLTDLHTLNFRVIHHATSGTLTRVRFASSSVLVTVGTGGRVDQWDTRAKDPTTTAIDPHTSLLTALAMHPARPTTIATGSACGVVSVWDIRMSKIPQSSTQAHEGPLWGVEFLPSKPACLLTCGEDGLLNVWDFNARHAPGSSVTYKVNSGEADSPEPPLMRHIVYQHGLGLNGLSIQNSAFGLNTDHIAVSCDSEEVLFMEHVSSPY